jgi:phage/plasmid-associated DNA primase
VASRTKHRIRPSDGATLFIDYPYPEYDKEKSTVLDSFLTEVFPDQDVRDYLVSELAKCLHMQQISPKVLLLYGHGGGGKGMTCRLAVEAFGKHKYAHPASRELFMKARPTGGEGVTSARMKLKNKLVVTANEVRGFDEDLVKEWCGSDDISARGHYQGTQQFTGTFNLVMFTFQHDKMIKLEKDGGLERRVFAIKTPNKYEDVKDAEAADALERRWNEEGETQMHAMYPEKEEAIMSAAPQLMHAALHPDPPAGCVQGMPSRNRAPHRRSVGGRRSREPASGAHDAVVRSVQLHTG